MAYQPGLPTYVENHNWCFLGDNIVEEPDYHNGNRHSVVSHSRGKYPMEILVSLTQSSKKTYSPT
jgi:hypothetical protein